jgi:hypothetical protein
LIGFGGTGGICAFSVKEPKETNKILQKRTVAKRISLPRT